MFTVGDKIVAKLKFLNRFNIPLKYREFEIIYFEKGTIKIRNKMGFEYVCFTDLLIDDFYINNNVNHELLQIIEEDKIEFASFNGVTVDGKIIEIRTTN